MRVKIGQFIADDYYDVDNNNENQQKVLHYFNSHMNTRERELRSFCHIYHGTIQTSNIG